jgi:multiple sugar transport system substrate-binding protein
MIIFTPKSKEICIMKQGKIISLSLVIILAAAFCFIPACSGKEENKTGAETKTDSAALSGSLNIWHYWVLEDDQAFLEKFGNEFMAENPGVKVTATYIPFDTLKNQYMLGAVSGNLPEIAVIDNPETAACIEMGICLDITDKFNAWDEKSYFFEGAMKSCIKDGRVYGIPNNINCLALFYDVDKFNEAGVKPPVTWDDLLAVCKTLKAKFPNAYPLGLSSNNNEEGTFHFIPFFLSTGASFDNLASPEAVRAASYWKELVDLGYVPKDVIGWGQMEVNNRFVSGNLIMQVNGPWIINDIRKNAPDKNWSVIFIPKDKKYASVLGGENFAITSAADPELGWAFLSKISSGKNVTEYCAGGNRFPPRNDAGKYSNVWDADPILKTFYDELEYAMPRGPHPRWNEFSATIYTALQQILTGTKIPEAALKEAQAASAKIMN